MHSYFVYGLNIESELELSQLRSSDQNPDVIFKLDTIENKPVLADNKSTASWVTNDSACITYKGIGTFLMRNGEEVIIDLLETANVVEVSHILLGVAISVILHQRGYLVLHSSVIEMGDFSVGFVGHSGNGKSSIATMMLEKGYNLISDDLAVVGIDSSDQYIVYSGYPQTKLWPDFVESIGINPDNLPLVNSDYTKRTRKINDYFTDKTTLPLKALYILDKGSEIEISDIKGHKCIFELVTYSYDIQLAKATRELPKNLSQCTQLAKKVPVKRLQRPWELKKMPDIVTAIEHDVLHSD